MIDVCLLGTGGVMPLPERWLTALLVRNNGKMLLIDCGEGTQIPIKLAGWGFKAIDIVLFTHYHGDHIAGLPGFLLTLGNTGRLEPLTLAGPPGLQAVVDGLTVISPNLPYPLKLIELSASAEEVFQMNGLSIKSLPVDHMIPCLAYSLELPRSGKFDVERAKALGIPIRLWNLLQKGENIKLYDKVVQPDMVLGAPRKGIKICYCTDSRPTEGLIDFISDADLFICEGMYGIDEERDKAIRKKHMTFSEAAHLAKLGTVGELWLTHYSPSLRDPQQHIERTRDIFAQTFSGHDLLVKMLHFLE